MRFCDQLERRVVRLAVPDQRILSDRQLLSLRGIAAGDGPPDIHAVDRVQHAVQQRVVRRVDAEYTAQRRILVCDHYERVDRGA